MAADSTNKRSSATKTASKTSGPKAGVRSSSNGRKPVAKRANRKNSLGLHGGTYITPRGNVTLGLPAFWTLRQTNDDLELDSPSGATSVIITAFHRERGFTRLDARDYLEQFLKTATAKGRRQIDQNARSRAVSRYRDPDGDYWQVEFLTDGDTLLLATMNSSLPPRSQEARTATQVLATIQLK
jgi:hypothetical protein